jgi:two-component system phosphate regulon sensor histidine kinase PhoR
VWCDSDAVAQILRNLLDNAIKYTPEGGRITVGARVSGKQFELYVRDTGIGIPEEDLPRLFERFYRVDKARSRELGGTGLGLSIVKHLVAAHGGVTRVESRLDQGSTFYFTLPSEEAAPAPPGAHSEFTAP